MTIALYLRLSDADGDRGLDGKNESNSIENQRELLHSYIMARDDLEGEVIEYVDDGYTGTNFNRPAFKRMIEDAKKGIIQVILVKDLSRLGRDYITAGDYIEQIFPLLNVRFIAANNGFDSANKSHANVDFDVAVSNLINTFYSRDLSVKRKSANLVKWKKGQSTSGYAPFGYRKSTTEKGKLEIDPEAAKTVRTIFDCALRNMTTSTIANYLNEEYVLTPWEYGEKHKNWGQRELVSAKSERMWTTAMVARIIRREEYMGAMVMGRHETLTVGGKQLRLRQKEEWTIVEGVNPALVTKEEYEKANQVIRSQQKEAFVVPTTHILKGKVRCGNCRRSLAYLLTGNRECYYCDHGREAHKYSKCCKDDYPVKQVESVVWYAVKEFVRVILRLGKEVKSESEQAKAQANARGKQLEAEIRRFQAEKLFQYELYADGNMTKEGYVRMKQKIDKDLEQAQMQLETERLEAEKQTDLNETAEYIDDLAEQYLGSHELTQQIADAFVQTVYVYNKKKVEVFFNHADEIIKMVTSSEEHLKNWNKDPEELAEA